MPPTEHSERGSSPLFLIARALDLIERSAVILCLFLIVALVFGGVLSRYVFHHSIAWSEELVRYLFMWGGLFGAAAAFRSGRHSGIPLIVDRLPRFLQIACEWAVMLGSAGFTAFMAAQAFRGTLRAFRTGQMSSSTPIPIWVVNGIMALAFAFCAIRVLQAFFAAKPAKSELDEELAAEQAARRNESAGADKERN